MQCPTKDELIKYINEVTLSKSYEQADLAVDQILVHITCCMDCYYSFLHLIREMKVHRN